MDDVVLPNGRGTSRLGFGCSGLLGQLEARNSRHLLEVALDAGFRHFDVAPCYGHGLAENILGDVLYGVREHVSIATKVGLGRPRRPGLLLAARSLARPILGSSPGRWLRRRTAVRGHAGPGRFAAEAVRQSLAESLRRLRTERVDVFLLHEITADELTDDLVRTLSALRASGAVGAVGTGASREVAWLAGHRYAGLATVRQYAWTAFEPAPDPAPQALTVVHRTVRNGLEAADALFRLRPDLPRRWAQWLDRDLADRRVLVDLLLGAALHHNPSGIVLVSSRRAERIRRFAAVAGEPAAQAAGAEFHRLCRRLGNAAARPANAAPSVLALR